MRLLVVEDEPIERQAILLTLRNHFPAYQVVAEAANGYDALMRFREEKPDLVLVDIGIPGMNGLEVIGHMREEQPATGFIILSSHDNFTYAQKAITLGVEDYLLKPASVDALGRALDAAKHKKLLRHEESTQTSALLERVEKIRPLVVNDLIYSIISGGDAASLQQMLSFLGIEQMAGFCMVLTENNGFRRTMLQVETALNKVGYQVLCGFYDSHSIFFILNEQPDPAMIDEILAYVDMVLKNHGYQEYHLGAGPPVGHVGAWTESYQQAGQAVKQAAEEGVRAKQFEKSNAMDFRREQHTEDYLSAAAGVFSRAVFEHQTDRYPELVQQTILTLARNGNEETTREDLYKLMVLVEQDLLRNLPSLQKQVQADAEILKATSTAQMEAKLRAHMHELDKNVKAYRDQSKNKIVDQAIYYIGNHFADSISLDTIAGELEISPYYLSKLLKKHTGKTCTELVCERRIEEAKKLLERGLSSKEVTYETGFNSQNYFTRVFKKYTGITPREYRNSSGI